MQCASMHECKTTVRPQSKHEAIQQIAGHLLELDLPVQGRAEKHIEVQRVLAPGHPPRHVVALVPAALPSGHFSKRQNIPETVHDVQDAQTPHTPQEHADGSAKQHRPMDVATSCARTCVRVTRDLSVLTTNRPRIQPKQPCLKTAKKTYPHTCLCHPHA